VSDKLSVTRLAVALGAEVRGLSLVKATTDDIATIKLLFLEHLVLFFPEQFLNIDAHVAFGRHFGKLESHPHLNNPFTQRSEVFELAASHIIFWKCSFPVIAATESLLPRIAGSRNTNRLGRQTILV